MTENQPPPAGDPLSEKDTEFPVEAPSGPTGDNEEGNSDQFLIAALGASAGGLEAFENFFRHMPADAGIAFAVVQHLAPDHASALPELLARHTSMSVEQARDRTKVVPNQVYIIPPNATLTIKNRILHVASPAEPRGHRMPIDSLFSSLAEDCGENAVCIMLSGTGTDGTVGLRAIKEYGGMAMAQTLESAQYDAILRSAIATGLVDHVLPVEEMPAKLLEYAAYLNSTNGKPDGIRDQIAPHIGKIHGLLRRRAGHDFSQYKESTIRRRLQRRMKALQIETVEQYVQVMESQPDEADRLFKDLLIGVTQFFRDTDAFETLGREVIPKLFEEKSDASAQVRACVVGCATGEEAYSIAILLCEHAATLDNAPKLQVFATDIDDRGLEMARKGRYPESIAEHVSAERLERFFTKQQNAYQVKRELREICIFSNHSFIKDPPFSRLDLISCRNVMIYLGLDLQQKIIPLFHYALRPDGYLFLGPSESASSHRELFRTVDKKHRIFQRRQTLPKPVIAFPLADISRSKPSRGNPPEAEEQKLKQLERIILQRYRPACVTVQENGDAVYFSGRIGRYLEPATGSPDSNVINMAREGLRVPLRTALHKAVTTHERVVQRQIAVQTNGSVSHVDLTVEPIAEFQAANLFMIIFEDVAPAAASATPQQVFDASSEETIRHLEGELRSAQEHAQAMFEELESSNEELKSANEEYQSTNEELETSKEEVQSFNEELETVNAELNRRVTELDHANSDLQNLNASTQIATIFLDAELHIKSFTPAAGAVFRLIPGDVGRPITDLAAQFANADFADDIKEVLRTLAPRERDLPGMRDQHYLVRILPYRTVHNVIEGVVITFTDVTQLKRAERLAEAAKQTAQDAKAYAENVVATVREPLLVLDADLRVQSANQSFYDVFRVPGNETIGRLLYDLGDHQWDIPELRRLLTEILPQKKNLQDFRVDHEFPLIGNRVMLLNAREILQQNGAARLILLAIEDITERARGEDARGRLAAIVDSSADAIFSKNLNGTILSWNHGAERLFGYTAGEAIGQPATMLVPPDRADEEPRILEHIRRGERVEHYETIRRRKDGTLLDISLTVSPILDENGQVVGASKIARDITDGKRIEQERRDMAVTTALRNTEAELARVARALTVGELTTSIAHEVNQPLAALVTNAQAGLRWLGGEAPNLLEAQESLALIVRDARRASEVIRRIREFLKKDSQQIEVLDINDLAKEAVDLARAELQKSHITLQVELSDDLPSVRGDRIQLQQVMLNLIMNGRDAMASAGDGSRELAMISQKAGADGVRVAVRDSGRGAAPEDLDRMFNAFFTTKPDGIGMGLSISRSIIEAHGGRIWAELNDGPGLTVQFSLPIESESS